MSNVVNTIDIEPRLPDDSSGGVGHVTLVRPAMVASLGTWSSPVTPPLGLAYLAAMLLDNGLDVACVDAIADDIDNIVECDGFMYQGLSIDDTVARIESTTDLIGVSCMFSQDWIYTKDLLRAIRRRFPDTPIVVGGTLRH